MRFRCYSSPQRKLVSTGSRAIPGAKWMPASAGMTRESFPERVGLLRLADDDITVPAKGRAMIEDADYVVAGGGSAGCTTPDAIVRVMPDCNESVLGQAPIDIPAGQAVAVLAGYLLVALIVTVLVFRRRDIAR